MMDFQQLSDIIDHLGNQLEVMKKQNIDPVEIQKIAIKLERLRGEIDFVLSRRPSKANPEDIEGLFPKV